MISFAGFDLTLDSKYRHLQQYLESVGHDAIPQADVIARLNSNAWPSPVMLRMPELPEIGINQLFWPTGFDRPAIGHFLISKDVYDALVMGNANFGTLLINTTGDVADTVSLTMFVAAMTPLFNIEEGVDDYPLYLLTLGDRRWRDWQTTYALHGTNGLQGKTFGQAMQVLGVGAFNPIESPAFVPPLDTERLSSKWASDSPICPRVLLMEALTSAYGRRLVVPFSISADGTSGQKRYDEWSQEKDDALWAQVEPRLVAGGRLTAEQVKRQLPGVILLHSSDETFKLYTLTELLGETSVGNGSTAYLELDRVKFDASYGLAVARSWLKNHRGTVDGTINGIVPLDLHAGVDYILATHRVDQCNTRIVRWGKTYQPNFAYSPPAAEIYGINARGAPSAGSGPYAHIYDSQNFEFTFGASGDSSTPIELELPGPGLYEIDFRIQAAFMSVPTTGSVYFLLHVFDEAGVFRPIGGTLNPSQNVVCQSLLTSSPPGPIIYTKIPGSYSLRWLEQLPGAYPFTGLNGADTPTLKVTLYSQAGACTVVGNCSLTVQRAVIRANAG